MPTLTTLAGGSALNSTDGFDLWPALVGNGSSPRSEVLLNVDEVGPCDASTPAPDPTPDPTPRPRITGPMDYSFRRYAASAPPTERACDDSQWAVPNGTAAIRVGDWKLIYNPP